MMTMTVATRRPDNATLYPTAVETSKCENNPGELSDYVGELLGDLDGWSPQPTQFGPFTGKGSQTAAAEAAKAAGHDSYVAFRINRIEDVALPPAAAPSFIHTNRDQELFEVIRGDIPFRAILDLDGCDEAAELLTVHDFEAIGGHMAKVAVACGVPGVDVHGDNIAAPVAMSLRPGKASAHAVGLGFRVADGPTGRAFGTLVRDTYAETPAGRELQDRIGANGWQKLWDVAKSGPASTESTMCMRLVGVPKVERSGGPVIPGSVLEPCNSAPVEWGLDPVPWLLQGDPDHEDTPIITLENVRAAIGNVGSVANHIFSRTTRDSPLTPIAVEASTLPDERANHDTVADESSQQRHECQSLSEYDPAVVADALSTIRIRMAEQCPDLEEDAVPATWSIMSYSRVRPGHCSVHDRVHDRAGAYVRITPAGLMVASCRRPDAVPLAVVALDPPTPAEPPPADKYDGFLADSADVTVHEQWNSVAFAQYIGALIDLYLKASYKVGKTKMLGMTIQHMLTLNARARIAILSARQTLTSKLVADIPGAKDYRDLVKQAGGNAQKLADLLCKAQILVCQVDSFGKIPSEAESYDMVVVDEVTALHEHVFQPDNIAKGHTRAIEGYTSTRHHLERAGRLYICDADLTDAQIRDLQSLRAGKASKVLHNTFKPFQGTPAKIVLGKAGRVEVTRQIVDKVKAAVENIKAGRPFTGIAVACHSVDEAEAIAKQLRDLVAPDDASNEVAQQERSRRVKLYTGRSSQTEKRQDFACATESWLDAIAVPFTTTMTVGVSGECPHIEDVFGLFRQGGNISDATSCQMLFRAREIKRVVVSIVGKPTNGLPLNAKDLATWSTRAANRQTIPGPLRGNGNPFAPQGIETSPETFLSVLGSNFVGSSWIGSALSSNRSKAFFVPRLQGRLEDTGCVVEVVDLGGDLHDLKKAAKAVRLGASSVKAVRAVVDTAEDQANDAAAADALGCTFKASLEAKEAVTIERFRTASEAFPAELAVCRAEEYDGRSYADYVKTRQPCGDPAAEVRQNNAQAAMFVVKAFEDRGGLTRDDVEELELQCGRCDDDGADWHRYHEHHAEAYKTLATIVRGDDAFKLLPSVGGSCDTPAELGTAAAQLLSMAAPNACRIGVASVREAGALVRKVFDALGLGDSLMDGGDEARNKVPLETLRKPSAALLDVMGEMADHGLRVFNDSHAARKAKAFRASQAKGKAPTLKAVVGLLGPALMHVGAYIVPAYRSEGARAKGRPSSYELNWIWVRDPAIEGEEWFMRRLAQCGEDGDGTSAITPTPRPFIRHPVAVACEIAD